MFRLRVSLVLVDIGLGALALVMAVLLSLCAPRELRARKSTG
jgi:hypothetical protein